MKTDKVAKTVREQMKLLAAKYGPIAKKAGAKLWQFSYAYWPADTANRGWICTLGVGDTPLLCGQGYGSTPHKAFTDALDKFKCSNPTKEG